MSALTSTWQVLGRRWQALAARERRWLSWAAAIAALSLVWWLAVAPALHTLRAAPAQLALLDGQLQTMRELAEQARLLQSQPKIAYDDALRALEASVRQQFGSTAQFSVSGERATLTLKGASAEALAQWLTQSRVNARVLPSEARLTRSPQGWDGTLVLSLPARGG